jgi:phosphoribosylglycinamide formyltransferase-1
VKSIVVLASGNGSLFQALADASAQEKIFSISALVVDRKDTYAVTRATKFGIPAIEIPFVDYEDDRWQRLLKETVLSLQPDLVVSAGFMRIIRSDLFLKCPTINAHPSLLPEFPGAHAVQDALAAGADVTGATVHLMDAGIDTGRILAQKEVVVLPGDTSATLHERIKTVEQIQLVSVVTDICSGKLKIGE